MNTDSSARERGIRKAMEESLPALRAFARGLCLDRMTADDLVQAACARALDRFEQVVSPEGVKSWLYRILYTQWQDTLRHRRRERNTLFQFSQHLANGEEQRQAATESRHLARLDVERALAGLAEEQRAAVVLVDMLGYGYQEAAQVLDLPIGTVASRVARARAQLASALSAGSVERKSQHYRERSLYETS